MPDRENSYEMQIESGSNSALALGCGILAALVLLSICCCVIGRLS